MPVGQRRYWFREILVSGSGTAGYWVRTPCPTKALMCARTAKLKHLTSSYSLLNYDATDAGGCNALEGTDYQCDLSPTQVRNEFPEALRIPSTKADGTTALLTGGTTAASLVVDAHDRVESSTSTHNKFMRKEKSVGLTQCFCSSASQRREQASMLRGSSLLSATVETAARRTDGAPTHQ